MRYHSVLCVYPYKRELKNIGFFPPIGLEYVASAIEKFVHNVKIIDLRYERQPLSSFFDDETDLVLVSYNWDMEEEFVKTTINAIPAPITVVVGGRHATEHVEELFECFPGIDGIVRGDGEEAARDIAQKGLSRDIDGLSFRMDGAIVHNKNRTVGPVRSDSCPNRKLRRHKYMATFDGFNAGIQIDLVLGSRGCPYNCKFCDFKFNPLGEKRAWSCRTAESVVSEIKTIEADVICFADDIFTADMSWVERLCDLLIKEGIKKKYVINARLEAAKRPEVLEKMYRAGFMTFLIGIESAHDKTLAMMNKGFNVKKIREYFRALNKLNFLYHCYFILGNIGESRNEMLAVAKFSHELGVDTLGLSNLRLSKYSALNDMLKGYDDYHVEKGSGLVYSDMLSVGDLHQIRRDVNASFYTLPVIVTILKKLVIHRLVTAGTIHKIIMYTIKRKLQATFKKRSKIEGNVKK